MKYFIFILSALFLFSCKPFEKIGTVNMISHRNVDPNIQYELKARYIGGSQRELRKSKATNIENAVEETVKKVPGGEFVMNAKIYQVKGQYYAVEGDVWGKAGDESMRGFQVGDRIVCRERSLLKKLDLNAEVIYGEITGIIDSETVYVRPDGEDRTIKVPIDKITKSE